MLYITGLIIIGLSIYVFRLREQIKCLKREAVIADRIKLQLADDNRFKLSRYMRKNYSEDLDEMMELADSEGHLVPSEWMINFLLKKGE